MKNTTEEKKENSIVPVKAVGLITNPPEQVKEAKKTAEYLVTLLDNKENPIMYKGKRYMEFGDWLTLANFYGLDCDTFEIGEVEREGKKWVKAGAKVIHIETGNKIAGAEGLASRSEQGKARQSYNQISSMAQTRAGSKALANALRWVVVLADIKGTPAEEMEGIFRENKQEVHRENKTVKPKSEEKSSTPKGETKPKSEKNNEAKESEIIVPDKEKELGTWNPMSIVDYIIVEIKKKGETPNKKVINSILVEYRKEKLITPAKFRICRDYLFDLDL